MLKPNLFKNKRYNRYNICRKAAKNNYLDILKLVFENKHIWKMDIIKSCHKSGCVISKKPIDQISNIDIDIDYWSWSYCKTAVKYGHIDLLIWAMSKGYKLNSKLCEIAAKNGRFTLLQWLRANNCPWDSNTYIAAVTQGNLEMLEWIHQNNCPTPNGFYRSDGLLCAIASKAGHLDVLKWLRSKNFNWDNITCENATNGDHLPVLLWARINGCPWSILTRNNAIKKWPKYFEHK